MRPGLIAIALPLVATGGWGGLADADPLAARGSWEGTIDFFTTGAPLAVDGPDSDTTQVDMLSQPASVDVSTVDVPATADVVAAFLYWGGTVMDQMDCAMAPMSMDDTVLLTPPGAPASTAVTADACYCAVGAGSYDLQACRADVTALAELHGMLGTWEVDQFAAHITNGSTDNASFSLVLIYDEPDLLAPRRVALYDGVEELYLGSRTVTLGSLDVDNPAEGDLAWYVLDGDVGGVGPESVTVTGTPGGTTLTVSDAINPVDNPMNRTINTTTPAQTGVNGVDIDRFDVSAALDPTDTAIDMVYTAGGDKYWVVYNLVNVRVFIAVISTKSEKTWALSVDADGSGDPTPGDTIRYTITLENDGSAPASVLVEDPIPAAAASWVLVDAGGGVDLSTPAQLVVQGIAVAPGGGTNQVVFDMVLSASSAGTVVTNAALFDAGPDGNSGFVVAPAFTVGYPPADAGPMPDGPATPDATVSPDARAVDATSAADANPGAPDANPGAPDANPGAPDAGGNGGADAADCDCAAAAGCDCRAGGRSRGQAAGILIVAAAVLLLHRRRHRNAVP